MKTSYNMISIIVFCLFLLTTHAAYASPNHGYAVDLLKGEGNVTGVKLAYQYHQTLWVMPAFTLKAALTCGITAMINSHNQT